MSSLTLSIIIPTLNEAAHITSTLKKLDVIRQQGHEIILCDGGSTDNTLEHASHFVDAIVLSSPGRATQMNRGANTASGDILCFLHADTITPNNIEQLIFNALKHSKNQWGFFNIRLSSPYWAFRIIEWFINYRSTISRVATGDQGIFLYRETFKILNGFSDIPLMEDIEITKRLKKISSPSIIKKSLVTSSRRWELHGITRTVLLMWQLRLRYFLGTAPDTLIKKYHPHEKK